MTHDHLKTASKTELDKVEELEEAGQDINLRQKRKVGKVQYCFTLKALKKGVDLRVSQVQCVAKCKHMDNTKNVISQLHDYNL